jgi:CubicO group peptidase (beta-lactamase class C family)
MKKTVVLFTLLLSTAVTFAQQQDKYKKIDSLLIFLADNNKFMGSVSLREKGKTVFEKAYGYADEATKQKATPETKYKIGSITKMFTASVIFKLIEDKKLTLDTKLSSYYPQVKNADKITINNLLGHSSGIFNFTAADDFEAYVSLPQTKEAMVARIASHESDFEPGTKGEYSNSNYLLLGYIIEDITKKPYTTVVTDWVIKKAGLKNTSFFDTADPKQNEASSYLLADTWEKWTEWNQSAAYAAGGIQATPNDLNTFITALFDGKIISKTSLEQMVTIQNDYGRGVFEIPFYQKKFLGHGGHIEGFSSMLAFNKEDGLAVALTINGEVYPMNDILIGIFSCYYQKPFPFPSFKAVAVDASILQSYVGTYASAAMPLKINVMYADGKFTAQATGQGPFPLEAVSATEFKFDPAHIIMKFTNGGFSLIQGGRPTEFVRE